MGKDEGIVVEVRVLGLWLKKSLFQHLLFLRGVHFESNRLPSL